MGQSQSSSAGHSLDGARPPTATQEPDLDPQERARMQAEERERRAAAVQQRITDQQKRTGGGRGGGSTAAARKKPSALEQLSAENRGWRAADEQAQLRSWD